MSMGNGTLERVWLERSKATVDEACEAAEGYLLACTIEKDRPFGDTWDEVRLARAQWFLLWALVQSRKDMV
jgi:hypothetical protein